MSSLLEKLGAGLPIARSELFALIATACYRYKVYEIPKRSGSGFRVIAQPAPEIKRLQRFVVSKVINEWPIHEAAIAYRRGLSIGDHAGRHIDSRFLLKLDFSDFFPSISAIHVGQHIKAHTNISEEDVGLLVNLLTWKNKKTGKRCLSIGAPSSPFVSNSMLHAFDEELSLYCVGNCISYSRYADDLALSTNEPNKLSDAYDFIRSLLGRLDYPRLSINDEKTVNVSRRNNRSLVGLNLTPDGRISIGRERKRELRAQMHRFVNGLLMEAEVAQLRGNISYVWSVEPEYIYTLLRKYGDAAFAALQLPFRLPAS